MSAPVRTCPPNVRQLGDTQEPELSAPVRTCPHLSAKCPPSNLVGGHLADTWRTGVYSWTSGGHLLHFWTSMKLRALESPVRRSKRYQQQATFSEISVKKNYAQKIILLKVILSRVGVGHADILMSNVTERPEIQCLPGFNIRRQILSSFLSRYIYMTSMIQNQSFQLIFIESLMTSYHTFSFQPK